jgi:hypothetical protein
MSNIKKFTEKELAELLSNPFVKHATHTHVRFTMEFKEAFWKRARAGEKLFSIIKAFGLDPEVLGERRIKGIYAHLNEQVAAGMAFTEERRIKSPENAVLHSKLPSNKEQVVKIRNLEHEVLYLRQELEFVKKIILADEEVKSKCSSKPGRPRNMK